MTTATVARVDAPASDHVETARAAPAPTTAAMHTSPGNRTTPTNTTPGCSPTGACAPLPATFCHGGTLSFLPALLAESCRPSGSVSFGVTGIRDHRGRVAAEPATADTARRVVGVQAVTPHSPSTRRTHAHAHRARTTANTPNPRAAAPRLRATARHAPQKRRLLCSSQFRHGALPHCGCVVHGCVSPAKVQEENARGNRCAITWPCPT